MPSIMDLLAENGYFGDEADEMASRARGAGSPCAKTTRVFRMEMPDGSGPWCSDHANQPWSYDLIDFGCADLAGENNEKMGVTEYNFREAHGHAEYGCDSLDAMGKWFPLPARKMLARHGAQLNEYELAAGDPLLVVGHGEVVFNKPTARKIASFDPVSMKPLA